MKILITACEDISKDNGTTVRAKRVRKALESDMEVALAGRSDRPLTKSLLVEPPGGKLWNLKLIPKIWGFKPDSIYCATDFFGFLTAYPMSRIMHSRVVFEAHGILSEEYWEGMPHTPRVRAITAFYKILEAFVAGNADHFVALSEDIARFYGRYTDRIDIVPVFIDDTIFRPQEANSSQAGTRTVGLIGPFVKGNINNTFIDFVRANIDAMDPRINIKVIGVCDDNFRFDHPRVKFVGYLESIEAYAAELGSVDAVVVPSRVPSFGALNKILEPMAMGKAVFTTPVGVVGIDGITPGKELFIAEETDLAKAISAKLFDEMWMRSVGEQATSLVKERYALSVNRTKLLNILR